MYFYQISTPSATSVKNLSVLSVLIKARGLSNSLGALLGVYLRHISKNSYIYLIVIFSTKAKSSVERVKIKVGTSNP